MPNTMNVIHGSPLSCQTTLTYWCGCVYHPTIKPNHKTQKEKNINTKTKPRLYWCGRARSDNELDGVLVPSIDVAAQQAQGGRGDGLRVWPACLPARTTVWVWAPLTARRRSVGRQGAGKQTRTNGVWMTTLSSGFWTRFVGRRAACYFFVSCPFFKWCVLSGAKVFRESVGESVDLCLKSAQIARVENYNQGSSFTG